MSALRFPEVFSPLVSLLVSFCWMVCPPSRGLVSPCLPLLLDGVSAFPRACLPSCFLLLDGASSCFLLLDGVSAFPKSCLPLSPFLFPFVGWCVCLPEVLSPFASPCLPLFLFLLPFVGWCVRLAEVLSPLVFPFVWWCVRLAEVLSPLVSHCLPACYLLNGCPPCRGVSLLGSLCWMVCLPSRGLVSLCFPLSPIVSLLACLCWMVCPPSPGVVSPGLPSCFLLLDGVSAFPRSCLPLSPHMCACVGWCVRLLEVSTIPLFSILSPYVQLCWVVCPPSWGLVSPFFDCVSTCVPVLDDACLISPCLPLSPHMCACVGLCFRLPI